MKIISPAVSALRRTALCGVMLTMLVAALPALAELGGDEASVQVDQAHIQAIRHIARGDAYNVHEMRDPTGNVVREFVSPAGKVFAVSWEGSTLPDLRQLLGPYFAHLEKAQINRRSRGPLAIHEPGLVLYSGGHMRAFVGVAYVPELVPQGVAAESIH